MLLTLKDQKSLHKKGIFALLITSWSLPLYLMDTLYSYIQQCTTYFIVALFEHLRRTMTLRNYNSTNEEMYTAEDCLVWRTRALQWRNKVTCGVTFQERIFVPGSATWTFVLLLCYSLHQYFSIITLWLCEKYRCYYYSGLVYCLVSFFLKSTLPTSAMSD